MLNAVLDNPIYIYNAHVYHLHMYLATMQNNGELYQRELWLYADAMNSLPCDICTIAFR